MDLSSLEKITNDTRTLRVIEFDRFRLYVITGVDIKGKERSLPADKDLELSQYNYFGIWFESKSFGYISAYYPYISKYDYLNQVLSKLNDMNLMPEIPDIPYGFQFVAPKQLEEIISRLSDKPQQSQMSGGVCSVCGSYDDYATTGADNKFYCYKHCVWN